MLGAWQHNYSEAFYSYSTTLCGALIEGKYYGDSACLVASSTPLQRAEFAALTPSLAPNPVSDIATLRFILPTAQGVTIEMYDMLGREVAPPLRFEALSSGMNALPIEMASLPRGVYAVRLRTALGLRATTMMVKE
ncbi:MAG: T9SS type A sorting domain-containing protein [Ignavibacteria bacterium]|nr:T9SS type A sorting domain-containing protein [Ignavibacteria bacterium]